ncbi:Unknown protein sequence [Pseudomonas syringae pv. cilantro]|uniref:Uncharacterized protein n=1 Tax=Pseudomonas syringae pv. cilantro TaxID=81035 RepID=A0A0N0GH19_PSESX|nr:Unknown protein sequence [Pseudomonas syringae pv. cilantro]
MRHSTQPSPRCKQQTGAALLIKRCLEKIPGLVPGIFYLRKACQQQA